ncbi:MAG: type II 3-dehydroquinate dehydratase [Chloroflexi bacterium]|nr:type II 3-dehydroquinate dehydratase [Chloroflexota bacterium]
MRPMRILLVNGPNLNTLGTREPEIYGPTTLPQIEAMVAERAATLGADVRAFQANSEGQIIDWLQREQGDADGLIINAGALTHTSLALRDAVAGSDLPAVEVHISNVWKRETFRHESYLSAVCVGAIVGLGVQGYLLALEALATRLRGTE